jgi:hypothetical protein
MIIKLRTYNPRATSNYSDKIEKEILFQSLWDRCFQTLKKVYKNATLPIIAEA